MKSFFISDHEPRLRVGWRLLLQTVLLLVILFGVSVPLVVFILFNPALAQNMFLNQVVSVVSVTASVFFARRLLDQRSITSLGLKINRRALIDLIMGILITLPMMGLIYLILWFADWLTFESFAWQSDPIVRVFSEVLSAFMIYIMVGWGEELLSRGYHLQTLESGLNTLWAVLISSVIFSLLHIANPNVQSPWMVIIGITLAGIFLAFSFLRTRQLWLPIGLHIGWNFFEGVVFGFPVSGTETYRLTLVRIDGPNIWTGGSFGPEAGLVLIPGLLLGFALIYLYTNRRLQKSP
jgi:membrane protease YdiL (CAAX protease family)